VDLVVILFKSRYAICPTLQYTQYHKSNTGKVPENYATVNFFHIISDSLFTVTRSLDYCATSRNVAGSIPDGVIGILC